MEGREKANTRSPLQSDPQAYQQLANALAPATQSQAMTKGPSADQHHRAFRKGGTMTALGEYIAEDKSAPAPVSHTATRAKADRLGPQIATSNVGYQLLQKAGWQEGQGIGANQQGRPVPLAAYHQQARQGIGAGAKAESAARGQKQQGRQAQAAGGANSAVNVNKQKQTQPVPDVPEALEVKRQRHQQVLQAEADDAAGKAISQYMYRAFNDIGGAPTSDSNPLVRRNKLSRTNPLL